MQTGYRRFNSRSWNVVTARTASASSVARSRSGWSISIWRCANARPVVSRAGTRRYAKRVRVARHPWKRRSMPQLRARQELGQIRHRYTRSRLPHEPIGRRWGQVDSGAPGEIELQQPRTGIHASHDGWVGLPSAWLPTRNSEEPQNSITESREVRFGAALTTSPSCRTTSRRSGRAACGCPPRSARRRSRTDSLWSRRPSTTAGHTCRAVRRGPLRRPL
jgi:hypothetical protein